MPRRVRYPEIGNHVKIAKKYVPTDVQNRHFGDAAATDMLTCEVVRIDIQRNIDNPRLDRRHAFLRYPPNPADAICEFVSFASKCDIIDAPPPNVANPDAPNLREIVMAVADAFNAVLGVPADEHVPLESDDLESEVEVEEPPPEVAAPREGWEADVCTIDPRPDWCHGPTRLVNFEGSDPFDYFKHFLPEQFFQAHLLPLLNAAMREGEHVDYAELLAWMGVLIRLSMFSVPEDVFWELPLGVETATVMCRSRFHAIWKVLQQQLVDVVMAGHPPADPHRHVAPLFKAFNERMSCAVFAGENLCLDESMLAWFGKRWLLDGWVTHDTKPIKFGYETKVMACPRTHLFLHMELCSSKRNTYVDQKPFYTAVRGRRVAQIMRMCEPWFASGRTITMDSGFGSPLAAALLKQHGLFSVMMTKKTAHWPQWVPGDLLSRLPEDQDSIACIKKRIPVERGVDHLVHITMHRSAKPRVYIHTAHVATRVPAPYPMYHQVGSGAARRLELRQVQPPEVGQHYSRTRSAVDAGNKERVSPATPLSECIHCAHPVPKVFLFILSVIETNAKLAWAQGQRPTKPHWYFFREKLSRGLLFMQIQERVRRRQSAPIAEPVIAHALKRYADFSTQEVAAVWGDTPPVRRRKYCSGCKFLTSSCCVCSTSSGLCINCFPQHVVNRTRVHVDEH
jgi:hypothetical protein